MTDYYVTSAYPGYKPWYKKALTTMQITQFVVDLFIVYFACASPFAWWLDLPLSSGS